MRCRFPRLLAWLAVLILSACSIGPRESADGKPLRAISAADVVDAQPRPESILVMTAMPAANGKDAGRKIVRESVEPPVPGQGL